MMTYFGGRMSGWGWFGMTMGMIVFWGLLIALAVLVYRALVSSSAPSARDGRTRPDPRLILAERYARGEIDEDEYEHRLAILESRLPT